MTSSSPTRKWQATANRHKTELATLVANAIIVAIILLAGALLVAIEAHTEAVAALFAILVITAATISALGVIRAIKAAQRADRYRWASAEKSLSRIAWLSARVPDIAGTVGQSRDDLSELLRRAPLAPRTEPTSERSPSSTTPATAAIRAQGPPTLGRGAGQGGARPENAPKLLDHLGGVSTLPDHGPPRYRVGVVGTQLILDALPPNAAGLSLMPGTSRAQVTQSNFDTVLIDEHAFDLGPWAGTLDAMGTNLFMELWDVLRHLRATGVLVVLFKGKMPTNHFTAELESQCSLVLESGSYDLGFGDNVGLPILDHVLARMRPRGATQ